jgi:glutaryl-CoA dehydrogenase (non-decarboxylating)
MMHDEPIPTEWSTASDVIQTVRRLRGVLAHDIETRFEAGAYNNEALEALAEAGLLGLTLPRRYDGQGRDYTALAAVSEELGRIDTAHQVSLTVHLGLAAMCILQWGNVAQREQWLPALARGEQLGTFGLTEPGAGSDVAALRTRARRVEGGYLLNGEKSWISSANQATLFILFATLDPALRHKGITAFIVPRESPGLSTTELRGKLGVRAGDTGTVVMRDVFVPDAQLLGAPGEGFAVALSALGNGLFTVGCGALGIAAETRRLTAALLREVGDDGRGWVGAELARMVAREETARLLLARAAALKNAGVANARETSAAKWTAAEAGYANAGAALDILQSLQAGEDPTLLRHWANAKGAVIYGGTAEIHQTMQAAYALGERVERPFRAPSPSAADLAS